MEYIKYGNYQYLENYFEKFKAEEGIIIIIIEESE